MDTVEEAKNVTALIVSTIAQVARTAGFSDKEISTAIDRAAAQAVATAQNINANQVAGQVANEVASQVAGQLAKQVATAVAAEVLKHDTPSSQQGGNDYGDAPYSPTQNQNNSPMTLPTAPGQPIIPGGNAPPNALNPESEPTPMPASSGGTR
jgi:beta-mannanase